MCPRLVIDQFKSNHTQKNDQGLDSCPHPDSTKALPLAAPTSLSTAEVKQSFSQMKLI